MAKDWLLDSCDYYCFLCHAELPPPEWKPGMYHPIRGQMIGIEILNEYGQLCESEERVCHECYCKG